VRHQLPRCGQRTHHCRPVTRFQVSQHSLHTNAHQLGLHTERTLCAGMGPCSGREGRQSHGVSTETDLACMRGIVQRLQLRGWHVLHIHADRLRARGQCSMVTPATCKCRASALLVLRIHLMT
jgi:hypothetical protein